MNKTVIRKKYLINRFYYQYDNEWTCCKNYMLTRKYLEAPLLNKKCR